MPPRHWIALSSFALLAALTAVSLLYASDGASVATTATQTITAFGVCKKVTNTSPTGKTVYVPTQSAAEWASFYANPPAGLTVDECAITLPEIVDMPDAGGCETFVVPARVTQLKVTAVGGGGGGSRSTRMCAYNMLSGAGGGAVIATVNVTPGQEIPYCVGGSGRAATGAGAGYYICGDVAGGAGGITYFGSYVMTYGGAGGQYWHYKGKDGRGRPPSYGGGYAIGTGVTVISAGNGASVYSYGACGGNSGLGMGSGSCSASSNGGRHGGGGYGIGTAYSNGTATAGGRGYLEVELVQ